MGLETAREILTGPGPGSVAVVRVFTVGSDVALLDLAAWPAGYLNGVFVAGE